MAAITVGITAISVAVAVAVAVAVSLVVVVLSEVSPCKGIEKSTLPEAGSQQAWQRWAPMLLCIHAGPGRWGRGVRAQQSLALDSRCIGSEDGARRA
jgi:hypothetical protein